VPIFLRKISKKQEVISFVNNLYHGEALQTENINLTGAQKMGFHAHLHYEQKQLS